MCHSLQVDSCCTTDHRRNLLCHLHLLCELSLINWLVHQHLILDAWLHLHHLRLLPHHVHHRRHVRLLHSLWYHSLRLIHHHGLDLTWLHAHRSLHLSMRHIHRLSWLSNYMPSYYVILRMTWHTHFLTFCDSILANWRLHFNLVNV